MYRAIVLLVMVALSMMILIPFAGDIGRWIAEWFKGLRAPHESPKPEEPTNKDANG